MANLFCNSAKTALYQTKSLQVLSG